MFKNLLIKYYEKRIRMLQERIDFICGLHGVSEYQLVESGNVFIHRVRLRIQLYTCKLQLVRA